MERWEAAEREPQLKNIRALAMHWGMEVEELQPDLAKEERQLQKQLGRIETKLNQILGTLRGNGVGDTEPAPSEYPLPEQGPRQDDEGEEPPQSDIG